MNRANFIRGCMALTALPGVTSAKLFSQMKTNYSVQLIRHATLFVTIGNKKILVDPMLSAKNDMDPVPNCGNDTRIPMISLPIDKSALEQLLRDASAVVVTHTHRDHWDNAAQQLIDKNKLIFCQPSDTDKIRGQGFVNVVPVTHQYEWEGITINRTGGRHGTGEIGQKMGEVSGFVFSHGTTAVYVAGDTIWCPEVKEALETYKPAYVIVNAGAAKFLTGDPITMTPQDITSVHAHWPAAKIVAVHMDTVNHCFVKRTNLKNALATSNWQSWLTIPADGEQIDLV